MILRAALWIAAMSVLLPHNALRDRNMDEVAIVQPEFQQVALDASLLSDLQNVALQSLQDLKDERAQFRSLQNRPDEHE
jgi:hypothetical protein